MPPSTIKCKYYGDDGQPLNARGCYNNRLSRCSYVHPDSPDWDYAERRSYWQHEPPPRSGSSSSSSSKYSSGKYRSYSSTDSSWGRPPPPPSSSSSAHRTKGYADAANPWSRRSESGADGGGGGSSRGSWDASADLPRGSKASASAGSGWRSGDDDKGTFGNSGVWGSGSVSGGDGWISTSAGVARGSTDDSGSWETSAAADGPGWRTSATDGNWGSTTDSNGWGSTTEGGQWPSTAGESEGGWGSASKNDEGWGKNSKTDESKSSAWPDTSKRPAAVEYANTKSTTTTASVSNQVATTKTVQSESAATDDDITDGKTLNVPPALDSTSSLTQDVSQAGVSITQTQKSHKRISSSPVPLMPTPTHVKPPSLAIDTRDDVIRVQGPRSESSVPESATSSGKPDHIDLLYNRPTSLIGRHQAWNALLKEIVRVLYLKGQREDHEAAQDGLRRSGLSEEHSHPGLAARQELENARRRKDIPNKSDKLRTLQARISKVPLADWPDLDLDQGRQEMESFVLELKDWIEKVSPLIHEVTRSVRKTHKSETPDSRELPEFVLPPHAWARYQLAEERLNECINDMPISRGVSQEEREAAQQRLMQDTYNIGDLPPPPLTEAKKTVAALREKLVPAIGQTFEFDELRKQNSETFQQLQEEHAAIVEKQNNIRERIERLRARAKRKEGSNIASQVQQLLQEPIPPLALSDDLVNELCLHAIHNVFKLEVIPLLNSFQQELIDSTSLDPSIYQSMWTHLQPAIQLIASIPLDNQHTL